MTEIKNKVDQLLMFGFKKDETDCSAGSLIIFERNERSLRKIKRNLFLAVDQEGGRINRIKKGVTLIPSLSSIKTTDEAYGFGKQLARDLIPLGINLNLAPVADVNTQKSNPIIGSRSFGSDTKSVSKLCRAIIKGMQDNGLLSCAKHFPGHGAAKRDSHKCLPRINISKKKWQEVHFPPFKEAIKTGVASIMVAHVLCPALDRKYPASLSYKVITEILRNKLKYKGVIITDDLGMDAIVKHYDPGEAAILAINAGADIITVCHSKTMQKKVRKALEEAVEKGVITKKRLNESVKRVLRLKKHKGVSR